MAGGCCFSVLGAVKTWSRASDCWTWPTVWEAAGEDASGFSPIRRRRGTSVLATCPRPSVSGGNGYVSSPPGSWHTRPTVSDRDGSRRLVVGGAALTPDGLHVGSVSGTDGEGVYFPATNERDPTERPL